LSGFRSHLRPASPGRRSLHQPLSKESIDELIGAVRPALDEVIVDEDTDGFLNSAY